MISVLICRAILICEVVVLRDRYREERECSQSGQVELQASHAKVDRSLAESWSEYRIEAQEASAF